MARSTNQVTGGKYVFAGAVTAIVLTAICSAATAAPFTSSAFGVKVNWAPTGSPPTNVGPLAQASSDGSTSSSLASVTVPGLLTTGAVTTAASAVGSTLSASAAVSSVNVVYDSLGTASSANAECTGTPQGVAGSTTLSNANFNGANIAGAPAPNTVVQTQHTTITFNEQISNPDGSLTVNAIHVHLKPENGSGDMLIGSATCAPPPVGDNTAPTVMLEKANGQTDPATTPPIIFDVNFSEPVTSFTDADVDLSASTAGGTLAAVVSGGPMTYTVTITGMTTAGNVTAAIAAGAAQDAANNNSLAATSADPTVSWQPDDPGTPPSPTPTPTPSPTPTPAATKCMGRDATIVGTEGSDTVTGTPGPDVIAGLGGNDRIDGRGGKDTICGGDGKDQLLGGAGRDQLFGGSGNDSLYGGPGRDLLFGSTGTHDNCPGGPGNDKASPGCEASKSADSM